MPTGEQYADWYSRTYTNGDRGEAVRRMRKAFARNDKNITSIDDIDEFLRQEYVRSFVEEVPRRAIQGLVQPAFTVFDWMSGKDTSSELEKFGHYAEPIKTINLPLFGTSSVFGGPAELLGSAPLIGGMEKIAAKGLYEAAIANKASKMVKTAEFAKYAVQDPAAALLSEEAAKQAPKLAQVSKAMKAAPIVAGAVGGALYSPHNPLLGAAVGGALGAAATGAMALFNKPLPAFKGNPQVDAAIKLIAGLRHETPEVVIAQMKDLAGLQAELAKHGQVPLDMRSVFSGQDEDFLRSYWGAPKTPMQAGGEHPIPPSKSVPENPLFAGPKRDVEPPPAPVRPPEYLPEATGRPVSRPYTPPTKPVPYGTVVKREASDLYDRLIGKETTPVEEKNAIGGLTRQAPIVYHGTRDIFTEFDPNKVSPGGMYGKGFYFSENEDFAKTFTKGTGAIKQATLDIKNPFDADKGRISVSDLPKRVAKLLPAGDKDVTHAGLASVVNDPNALLKSLGYDGLVGTGPGGSRTWVAFDPKQVKPVPKDVTPFLSPQPEEIVPPEHVMAIKEYQALAKEGQSKLVQTRKDLRGKYLSEVSDYLQQSGLGPKEIEKIMGKKAGRVRGGAPSGSDEIDTLTRNIQQRREQAARYRAAVEEADRGDKDYSGILSTGSKDLKKGETLRSRILKFADAAERTANEMEQELAKLKTPRGGAEEGGLFKLGPDGSLMLRGADIAPDVALASPATTSYLATARKVAGSLVPDWIQLPHHVAARDETGSLPAFFAKIYNERNRLLGRKGTSFERGWNRFVDKWKPTESEFDEFAVAHRGLRTSADGSLTQSNPGLSQKANDMAKDFEKRFVQRLWREAKGMDPRVGEIFRENGVEYNEANLRTAKRIQDLPAGAALDPKTDPALVDVAQNKLYGTPYTIQSGPHKGEVVKPSLLYFDESHDLSGPAYNEAKPTLMPVENELHKLKENIRETEQHLAMGGDPNKIAMYQAYQQAAEKRVKELEDKIRERSQGGTIMGHVLPKRSFYGPLAQAADQRVFGDDLMGPLFETDMNKIAHKTIWNMLSKRYHDILYTEGRKAYANMTDRDLKQYLSTYIDGQRGIKGFNEDSWIRRVGRAVKPLGVPEDSIRGSVSSIMKLRTLVTLFSSLRFPLANATQTWITVYPIVGEREFGSAVARLVHRSTWTRAEAAGVLTEAGSQFLREAEAIGETRLDRVLKSKWLVPAKLAELTEEANRVLAFDAGFMASEKTAARMRPLLRTYYETPGRTGTSFKARVARGKALVDTTQFILSRHGKPTGFTGGAVKRLAGQFRSFSIGYMSLIKDLAKYDKPGLGRALGSLWVLGGLPLQLSVGGFFLRHFGVQLPWNGLGTAAEKLGIGGYLPSIDITSSVEPFNWPQDVSIEAFGQSMLGPTLGPLAGIAESAYKEGPFAPQTLRQVGRFAVPNPFMAAGEAISEYREGGVFTRGGAKIAQPSTGRSLMRLVGLRPSVRKDYYDIRSNLENALRYGDPALVNSLRQQARDKGIVITDKTISQIKGQIKAETRKHRISSIGDVFSR